VFATIKALIAIHYMDVQEVIQDDVSCMHIYMNLTLHLYLAEFLSKAHLFKNLEFFYFLTF